MNRRQFKIIIIDEHSGEIDMFETDAFRLETDREIINDTFYATEEV